MCPRACTEQGEANHGKRQLTATGERLEGHLATAHLRDLSMVGVKAWPAAMDTQIQDANMTLAPCPVNTWNHN